MSRKFVARISAIVAVVALPLNAQAVVYSPTQAELNSVAFVDFWAGNGASLDSSALVGPQGTNPNSGVTYTFDTGPALPTPDDFGTRTQFEAPFTQDLTSFDAFNINFLQNSSASPLQAQIFLRYAGGGGFSSNGGGVAINGATQTTLSIPMAAIPLDSRSQITSFGIEIFSLDSIFHEPEANAMVSAYTSPQPPNYVDTYIIADFEGPGGTGSLDGWGPGFTPTDTTHSVVASTPSLPDHPANNGVTQGTHALELVRQRTGTDGQSFRWGSQMRLTAAGPAPAGDYNNNGTVDAADYTRWRNNLGSTTANLPNDPTPTIVDQSDYTTWKTNFGQTNSADPVVQAQINDTIDAINDGDQIAFDVSFFNKDNFPDVQPGYLGYHVFIQDGSSSFWQSDLPGIGFPNIPAVGSSYDGLTLAIDLSTFTDRSPMPVAGNLSTVNLQKTGTFAIGLATNTGVGGEGDMSVFSITLQVDNFRVRKNTAAGIGSAGTGGVPEPSTALLAALALMGVSATRKR